MAEAVLGQPCPELSSLLASSVDLDAVGLDRLRSALEPLLPLEFETVRPIGPSQCVAVGVGRGVRWRVVIGVEDEQPHGLTDIDFHRDDEVVEWDELQSSVRIDGDETADLERLAAHLGSLRSELRIPGIVAALRSSTATGLVTIGFADPWTRLAMSPTTRLRFSSLLKPWTAVAALQLVEDGRIDLDEPVFRSCPVELPHDITLRHLLTHTSGLDPLWPMPIHSADVPPPTSTFDLLAAGVRAAAPPATVYAYSNIGYGLVGLVIESLRNVGYSDVIMERVAAPLRCGAFSIEEVSDGAAASALEGGAIVPAARVFPLLRSASGGWGTVDDHLRFAAELLTPSSTGPITPSIADALCSGSLANGLPSAGGPLHRIDIDEAPCFSSVGGWPGFSGTVAVCPRRGFAITVLMNRSIDDRGSLPVDALSALLS